MTPPLAIRAGGGAVVRNVTSQLHPVTPPVTPPVQPGKAYRAPDTWHAACIIYSHRNAAAIDKQTARRAYSGCPTGRE